MATAKKISQMTAVVTPAGTDSLAVDQAGTTKKLTVTQLLTLQDAVIATISQADAEAGTATDARLITAQRMKQAIDALASGGITWEIVTAADTIGAGEGFHVNSNNTFTITLATTIAANEEFIIHVISTASGVISFEPASGHTVQSPVGADVVGGTDTITIAAGETLHLLALSSSILEIV